MNESLGMLGLKIRGDQLFFDPCISRVLRIYIVIYQHENARYQITVENSNGVAHGITKIELDGEGQVNGKSIVLQDDGQLHQVLVVLG